MQIRHSHRFFKTPPPPFGRGQKHDLSKTRFVKQDGPETEPEPSEPFFQKPTEELEPLEVPNVGTLFQEPKLESEPFLSKKLLLKTLLQQQKPFPERNRRTPKPEPLEPSYA